MTLCETCLKKLDPIEIAKAEVAEEEFRAEVEKYKIDYRDRFKIKNLIPFTIEIKWRKKWIK